MKTRKEINFDLVAFITYYENEYEKDVPVLKIVNNYLNLKENKKGLFLGTFNKNNKMYSVKVDSINNSCFIDDKKISGEEFIEFMEDGKVDPIMIIKRLTGIDLDDYIKEVTYLDGSEDFFEL